ncbi:MAG: YbaB/EbfC family nucleoid-associated protein [Candidatus Omnitrophica bacterium]|nr:YbaB/EbfC family nucleoid-associated protein [Candidatus Omnitrophota bacterium]
MFDKMKQLMEMQNKMQEMKRELENTYFDVLSSDGLVKVTMNGAQEVREIVLQSDAQSQEKTILEKSLKDAYNRAIKRSHDIAAEKMKRITGMNIPGLI